MIAEPSGRLGREEFWNDGQRAAGYQVIRRSLYGRGRPGMFMSKVARKLPRILALLRDGKSCRVIQRHASIGLGTAVKVRDLVATRETIPACRCGLPHGHSGFCRGKNPRDHWQEKGARFKFRLQLNWELRAAEILSVLHREPMTQSQIRNLAGLTRDQIKTAMNRLVRENKVVSHRIRIPGAEGRAPLTYRRAA
jgi:hypothetical protein